MVEIVVDYRHCSSIFSIYVIRHQRIPCRKRDQLKHEQPLLEHLDKARFQVIV